MMRTALPLLVLGLAACTDPDGLDEERWALVWEDDFQGADGDSPNPDNWRFEIGNGENGWGNSELQYYTDRPENVSVDGYGFLRITARREDYEGSPWTSARITTQDRFEFTYGRVEARMKLPTGRGFWPAFWMLGANFDDVGWPTCGEIDIMEGRGRLPDEVSGAVHGPGFSGGGYYGETYEFPEDTDFTDFHVYRVDWDPEHITWYVDGEVAFTGHPGNVAGPWVFHADQFLLLNLAVGGIFDGDPDPTTPPEGVLAVDWVRVYERNAPFTDPRGVE